MSDSARASEYDAFISYSHAADGLLAPRLQSALQRFAKPWWKRRAVRVFRDESSLSANPHLWSSITEALDQSEWFVLLLSPDAAESQWVNQEIEYWKAHRDSSRVLPVVTDGSFGWNDGDVAGNAVPAALEGVFEEEPRWVDVRFARSDEQLGLKNPRFSNAVADIASALRGIPKDELESEEVRQHARTVRTAWAGGLVVAALAVATTATAIQAMRNAALADARALATASVNVLEADPELSLLLALASADAGGDLEFEQRRALHAAIDQDRARLTLPFTGPWIWATFGVISPDARTLAVYGQRGVIEFYDISEIEHPKLLWVFDDIPVEYEAVPIMAIDSEHVLVDISWPAWDKSIHDSPPDPALRGTRFFKVRTGEQLPLPQPPADCGDADGVAYEHSWFVWVDVEAHAGRCWFGEPGQPDEQRWWIENLLTGEVLDGPHDLATDATGVQAKANGSILHYGSSSGLVIIDLVTSEEMTLRNPPLHFFTVATGAKHVVSRDFKPNFTQLAEMIRLEDGSSVDLQPAPAVTCQGDAGLSPDGLLHAAGCDDGAVWLVDTVSGHARLALRGHDGWPIDVMFDASGRFVVSGSVDGTVKIWDLEDRGEIGRIDPPDGYLADASLSIADGRGAVLVYPNETESPFSTFMSTMTRMATGIAWVFDVESGEEIVRVPGVGGKTVRLSPDGSRLAAQTIENGALSAVAVSDVVTGRRLVTMDGMCSWDPDLLATAPGGDGIVGVCEDGDLGADATDLAWSPDGTMLAMAGGASQRLRVWDGTTGEVLFTSDRLGTDTFALSAVQFDPTGSTLAVSSKTGMWFYDTTTWQETKRLTHTGRPSWVIRFTPDGSKVVTAQAHRGQIRIYDGETFEETDLKVSAIQSRDMALSSDGTLAALASKDGQVHVVDIDSGEVVELIDRVGREVTNVEFIHDDRHLLITTTDGVIEIVTLDVDELLDIARSRASRSFTSDECETYRLDPCPTLEELRSR